MLHKWVALLLSNPLDNVNALQRMANEITASGYPLYITDSLDAAKAYVRERYADSDKRFGLLASRYAGGLQQIGIDNTQYWGRENRHKNLNYIRWFNANPREPESCCSLSRPATEFECQGLEVDFPVLVWGDDYTFDGEHWNAKMPDYRTDQGCADNPNECISCADDARTGWTVCLYPYGSFEVLR